MRRSLALRSFFVSLLIVITFFIPLALLVRSTARAEAISAARSDARALVPILSLAGDPRVTASISSVGRNAQPRQVSVVFPDGSVLGSGEVVEPDPLADPNALRRARLGESLVVDRSNGSIRYEPVLRSDGTLAVIRVFIPRSQLFSQVRQKWAILAVIGVALVGLSVFVYDRIARSIVRSVRALADTANRLGRGEITARHEARGPEEVREVGVALNALAIRIDELLGTERAAAADLQHRLRTPVTALRAEVASLGGTSEAKRLDAGLTELTRAIDEIIREAAEPTRRGIGVRCDLADIVRKRAEFWSVLAEDQNRPFTVSVDGSCDVPLLASDVGAVIDALIDNVFSHTPDGTAMSVRVLPGADTVLLRFVDDGPGFGSQDIVRGASGKGSTGLGLDIVRKVVEGVGGTVNLSEPGLSTSVTLIIPRIGDSNRMAETSSP